MRFAAVSCPLAPQASHASSSVSRQFRALRSISSPLGGSHPYPAVQRQVPMSVYFGGSRNLSHFPVSVVRTVLASGQAVHVGCQKGADSLVVTQCLMQGYALSLVVFAVAPNSATAPDHVIGAAARGARVVYSAGGQATPIKARYLLRSIAAFQGCSSAVFFSPGAGSLAVAREALKAGLPVFAFGEMPARVPSSAGAWVVASFMGFSCWQWSAPIQQALF